MMPIHFCRHVQKQHAKEFRRAAHEAHLSLEQKAKDEHERKVVRARQMKELLKGVIL